MHYLVYDNITGEILRYGTCPENQMLIQAVGGNETAMESQPGVTDATHSVSGGVIIPIAPAIVAARAVQAAAFASAMSASIAAHDFKDGKITRILQYLKTHGVDLGPDGADL